MTVITGLYALTVRGYSFPYLTEDDMRSKKGIKRVIKSFLKAHKNDEIYCISEWSN